MMPASTSPGTRSPHVRRQRFASASGLLFGPFMLLLALVSGCGSEDLIPQPPAEPADLYWDLELDHHAVVLSTTSPYDTLQLVATTRNFRNEPLVGLGTPVYRSSNEEKVIVTNEGRLVAVGVTSQPVAVVATLTTRNLKHADTVLVSVVDEPAPPTLTSVSIHPIPPDSAKSAAPGNLVMRQDSLPVRAVTAGGESMPVYGQDAGGYLPMYFRSSDTTIAKILGGAFFGSGPGVVEARRVGSVEFYATTTAFGVTKTDTLPYRIGWPVLGTVTMEAPCTSAPGFCNALSYEILVGPDIVIGTGGFVYWWAEIFQYFPSEPADTIDITFVDSDVPNIGAVRPVAAALNAIIGNEFFTGEQLFCSATVDDCDNGGNMLLTRQTFKTARYFPVPGTYEYRSVRKGLHGRITVVDER